MTGWAAFAYVNGALSVIALWWAGVLLLRAYQWLDAHEAQRARRASFFRNLNAVSHRQ